MKLDQIEIKPETGAIQLRFIKVLYDAEGNEVNAGYHRDTIKPGDSVKLRQYLKDADAAHIENNVWVGLEQNAQ
mgnify:CR=1 FL=1